MQENPLFLHEPPPRGLRLPAGLHRTLLGLSGVIAFMVPLLTYSRLGSPQFWGPMWWPIGWAAALLALMVALGRWSRIEWYWNQRRPKHAGRAFHTRHYDETFKSPVDTLLSWANTCWWLPVAAAVVFVRPGRLEVLGWLALSAACWLTYWVVLIWRLNKNEWAHLATKD